MRYIFTLCHFLTHLCQNQTFCNVCVLFWTVFMLFLVLCFSSFGKLCFASITFKLEYLCCTTFPCHFWANYCYIYSFILFSWLAFFPLIFSCSLAPIFLSCPLLLLSPTLISVFLLLLPFVQYIRQTHMHVLLLSIPFYLPDHQRVINEMPKSLAIQRTKAWAGY